MCANTSNMFRIIQKIQRVNESHVHLATRLTTHIEYYLKLGKISDFEILKQINVSVISYSKLLMKNVILFIDKKSDNQFNRYIQENNRIYISLHVENFCTKILALFQNIAIIARTQKCVENISFKCKGFNMCFFLLKLTI